MNWIVFSVQQLHVLLGILWFGNSLVLAAIIIPAINRLPLLAQREIGIHLNDQAQRILEFVAPAVMVEDPQSGWVGDPDWNSQDVLAEYPQPAATTA